VSHPTLEAIAAWVEGLEAPNEGEALELHLLECGECCAQADRMQQLVATLRGALPPILTEARHRALLAEHATLPATHVEPGQTGVLRLSSAEAVGVWVMHCDLTGVTRVDFEARGELGQVLLVLKDVPFDAARGQVLLACQLHYRAVPDAQQMRATLRADDGAALRELGQYILDHQFESP
jgi:hypothetical protein